MFSGVRSSCRRTGAIVVEERSGGQNWWYIGQFSCFGLKFTCFGQSSLHFGQNNTGCPMDLSKKAFFGAFSIQKRYAFHVLYPHSFFELKNVPSHACTHMHAHTPAFAERFVCIVIQQASDDLLSKTQNKIGAKTGQIHGIRL